MWPFILLGAAVVKLIIDELIKENKQMANCQDLFEQFNKEISIPKAKKDKLKDSKDNLRKRIRKYFKEHHPEYEPKFYIQGSYKMKTMIDTKDGICDLDDGVYFMRKPDVTGTTLQQWVWNAVDGYTSTTPQHRKKCVRNIFVADYEIDMPVYYKIDGQQYKIAVKNEDWRDDDPKAMVEWFNDKKGGNSLVKIVKCLKAWCDYKRNYMPSGLAMTILAANAKEKFVLGDRDDINLKDTLKEIKKALDLRFECIVPVDPKDNLFANFDEDRKKNFIAALKDFVDDAEAALREENQLKASRLWRKHLGDRFPLGEDKNDDNKAANSRLIAGIGLSSPYGLL